MSAMELHIDHLAALVNIGHQLNIRNVYSEHSNLTQRLALDEERDRNYVLTELVCQMRTSVAYRYSERAPLISDVPEVHMVRIPLDTIADLAQAIHCFGRIPIRRRHLEQLRRLPPSMDRATIGSRRTSTTSRRTTPPQMGPFRNTYRLVLPSSTRRPLMARPGTAPRIRQQTHDPRIPNPMARHLPPTRRRSTPNRWMQPRRR
jgi:hypothetical protein